MGFECNTCNLFFEEKPTYTTTCPICKNRLLFIESNINNFDIFGDLRINKSCISCGKYFNKWDTVYILEKYHQNSETTKSNLVHSICYNKDFNSKEKQIYKIKKQGFKRFKDLS